MGKQNLLFSIVIAICVILTVMIQGAFAQTASSDIKALFSGERAFSHVDALEALGPRVAGSAAEQEAAEYIANEMSNYGFDVEIQQFETPYFEELSTPLLEQISPNPTSYIEGTDFATMTYSGSGDVTAPIQDVDLMMPPTGGSTSGCEAPDFAGFTAGNIALIQRGTCSYALKAQNAEAAGAVGVIIFNEGNTPDRTGIPYGTLGAPGVLIPVVGASFALGEELYNLTLGGDVTVHMIVDAISDYRTSQNIIGTKEGLDPSQGIVYMGAHYDTVSTSPGANDNASGVAALLEAARVLNLRGYTKATQKFIAFGAKEVGLDGSYNYVNENYDEITTMGIGMINLDMIGVGDTLLIGNSNLAAPDLKNYTGDKATAMSLVWDSFSAGTTGDQYYFEEAEVPSVYIQQSPDPNYHTAQDTLDKIDITTLEKNGELATAVMYDWAKNPALRAKKSAQ